MLQPLNPQPENLGNTDGYPHLAYYDSDLLLSLVINELTWPMVQVSHGGYAEPVMDEFEIETPFNKLTMWSFGSICKSWVQGYRKGAADQWNQMQDQDDKTEPEEEPKKQPDLITIAAPHVPYAVGSTDAEFMLHAADRLERDCLVGGSNVKATVVGLLRDVAAALDAKYGVHGDSSESAKEPETVQAISTPDVLLDALRMIGGKCENLTSGRCSDEAWRKRDATFTAEKWGDACIAEDALKTFFAEVRS